MDRSYFYIQKGTNPRPSGTTDSARYPTRNSFRTKFYIVGSVQLETLDQDPTSISKVMFLPGDSFWKGALGSETKIPAEPLPIFNREVSALLETSQMETGFKGKGAQ